MNNRGASEAPQLFSEPTTAPPEDTTDSAPPPPMGDDLSARTDPFRDSSKPPPTPEAVPLDIDTLFRSYASYVAAIAVRLLGRGDEVEDLVQDVFLEAHRGLHRVQEPAAIRGWLAKITVRMGMRRLKKRRAMRMLWLDATPDYDPLAAPGASPEQRALLAAVYRTLDTLPTDERVAWTLRHVEGEKLEDIADLMGCSLSTAKRRIDSAQAALRNGGLPRRSGQRVRGGAAE